MLAPSSRLLPASVIAAVLACQPAPSQPTPAADAPAEAKRPEAPPTKQLKDTTEWSFEFKDPPAGARAPTYAAFGTQIGTSMFDEVGELVRELGLDCGDTSIRAMMDRRREKEQKRLDDAKTKGEDAVTAASWMNRRSKREANPQIRYSCPKISAEQIGDRMRTPATGRLLYVFDSVNHPLRHASFQRTHQDHAAALADFKDTIDALTKIYGAPTKPLKGDLPAPGKDGAVEFPSAVNFEVSWEYADLLVRTNILRYGKLVTVGERVEIPHGLRPDAPRVRPGAKAPEPATPPPTRTADPTTPPVPVPDVKAPAKADAKAAGKTPPKPPIRTAPDNATPTSG